MMPLLLFLAPFVQGQNHLKIGMVALDFATATLYTFAQVTFCNKQAQTGYVVYKRLMLQPMGYVDGQV